MSPPFAQWNWSEDTLPATCSVVDNSGLVLSYHPRLDRLAFSKDSENSNVPVDPDGGVAAVTVIDAVPLLLDAVAVMVAVPADTPVTTPLLTVATAALLDDHATVWPLIAPPF